MKAATVLEALITLGMLVILKWFRLWTPPIVPGVMMPELIISFRTSGMYHDMGNRYMPPAAAGLDVLRVTAAPDSSNG
ncbi:MAG: hypothetical protein SCK70_13750 [bacterium]|nr:hypothetical protein [bacterium]